MISIENFRVYKMLLSNVEGIFKLMNLNPIRFEHYFLKSLDLNRTTEPLRNFVQNGMSNSI